MREARLTFLVVEDNELDVEKIERAFRRLRVVNRVVNARDGIEALERLRGDAGQEALAKPYVVLLDLNMPRMNGIEFLEELRADEALQSTPVFVLTTSDREADVQGAYRHNVAGYVVKPLTREGMVDALGKLDAFWELCIYPEASA